LGSSEARVSLPLALLGGALWGAAGVSFPPPDPPPLETLDDPSTGIDADPDDTPPPPPSASEVPPAPQEPTAVPPPPASGDGDAPPTQEPPTQPSVPLDERGDPILAFTDAADQQSEIRYAEAPEPEPEVEFAEAEPPTYEVTYAGVDRPPPPPEQLEREGDAGLAAARQTSGDSPQRFAVELKMGPYLPSVDGGLEGGPYEAVFGQTDPDSGELIGPPKQGVFPVLGFEWQFINLAGPMSIGTTIGMFRDSAAGLLANPGPDESPRSPADEVKFTVIPVTLLFGYRFSLLADRWKVPLVPYARAGLAYGFWESREGSGSISTNDAGERGRGGSIGWQANLGGMLRLDFIDYNTARELDAATGINHTYLFGEYQLSRLDGFGSGDRMSVGDDTWLVGLALEF
jgi:hypothetical protein